MEAAATSSPREAAVPATESAAPRWRPAGGLEVSDFVGLTKFRLSTFVVLTAMMGYAVAPGALNVATLFWATLGTGLCSGSANAFNQWLEAPFDAQMRRTRQRPVVRHAMLPHHAFAFAAVSGFSGVALLCATVNPVVAALGLANIVLYAGVYTWTKRVSIVNTWVGAVVGAIPPMMGWAACTGGLEPGAWLLAGVLYAWQFPHFNALAWSLREDYFKAGYRMAVVSNIGLNARVAFRYAVVLLPLSFGAVALDLVTPWFALTSGVLNVAFIEAAWRFLKTSNKATAKTLFFRSLIFLPAWCILLMFHKKSHATYHDDEEDGDDHDPKLADPPRRSRFFVWRDRLGFLGKPCEHAL